MMLIHLTFTHLSLPVTISTHCFSTLGPFGVLSVVEVVVDVAMATVVEAVVEISFDITSFTLLLTLFRLLVVLLREAVVDSVVEQSVWSLLDSLWLVIFPVGVVGVVGLEGECHPSSGLSWALLLSEVELKLSVMKYKNDKMQQCMKISLCQNLKWFPQGSLRTVRRNLNELLMRRKVYTYVV